MSGECPPATRSSLDDLEPEDRAQRLAEELYESFDSKASRVSYEAA